MCIATWVKTKDQFILTHTRDERIDRPFSKTIKQKDEIEYLEDIPSKGTWMINSSKYFACLLNGANDEVGIIKDSNTSRGTALFELDRFENPEDFFNSDFKEYSAFTLIIFDKKTEKLYQFFWNGNDSTFKNLKTDQDYLWCSSTLYSKDEKGDLSKDFINSKIKNSSDKIQHWHLQHQMPLGKVHPKIKSVCLSQISYNLLENQAKMQFFPLILE